jgi:hypothetical protein
MSYTNSLIGRMILVAISVTLLLWRSPVVAQQPMASDMLQRYGSSSAIGEYAGTLYCIRCNFSPTPENLATCNTDGHEHFLLMNDGHVHPLYGITKNIADKINSQALHEKPVKIRGRYYPVANAILVSQVDPVTQ